MTMLITKFNKLIANKFVWIGFTVLIVLAFVAWDMAVPEDARNPSAGQTVGTLFDEPVTSEELRTAYVHTYMSLALAMGQAIPITEEVDEELTRMAWRRLASLKKGEELGLRTTNQEVVAAIRGYAGFQQEGQFQPQIYQTFVNQYLPSMGFRAAQFEAHIRQELVLQKLQRMVVESVLVAPSEVERHIGTIGDEFTVHYALVDEEILGEGLEPSPEEVRAFFDDNMDQFMIPPKVRVDYVEIPVTNYMDEVEVTDEQALSYYDLNVEEFERTEAPAPTETDTLEAEDGDDDLFQVTETIPYEEVEDEIKQQLRRDLAERRAADMAMDFVVSLVPDRNGEAPSFEEGAADFGLRVEETAPFSRSEVPENIDAGTEFAAAAFELRIHPEYYFSDVVQGEDHMYVIALRERIDEREPQFAEVADEVREAAKKQAIAEAVGDLADTFRQAAQEGLETGTAFTNTAEQFAIPVEGPVTFTASADLESVPYGEELIRTVLTYNEGEVTEPVALGDQYLVAHLLERVRADPAQFADFRPQIVASLVRERGRTLFEEWQNHLLTEANFTTREDVPRQNENSMTSDGDSEQQDI